MSKLGLIYRLEFINVENEIVRIDISPTDVLIPDADDPQIIALQGGAQPLIISASNNDQDKYTPIRSKSAKIQFVSSVSDGLDSSTFSQGGDDLFKVDITLTSGAEIIFTGFLIMADNQQPFQPDPQYVTLTATDHLGAIKEAALTDLAGVNPLGKYRVADLITFCLRKTGLSLPLRVINNLRAGGGQLTQLATFSNSPSNEIITAANTNFFYTGQIFTVTGTSLNNTTFQVTDVGYGIVTIALVFGTVFNEGPVLATFTDISSASHWYDVVFIDAKTFEKEIGTCEDCYAVLSKILGEDSYITQWLGEWWIMRVDEFDGLVYVAEFDSGGVYITTEAAQSLDKQIGASNVVKFANADTLLRFVRPHQFVKETFNFNTPLENPCNVDFSRGDLNTTISPAEKWFDLDCWTKRRGLPGAYFTPITITDFIKRLYNANGYETDRYIFLTPQTGHSGTNSTDEEYIESEPIPVLIKDKVSGSIQWKIDSDITTSSANLRLFRFILHGDDGSYWILGEATIGDGIPIWYNTSGWTLNSAKGETGIQFSLQDETEWQTISWEVPPMPVSGDLFIWIGQFYQNTANPSLNQNVSYSNLNFQYIPFINGSYQKYVGQYNQVTRTEPGYLANRDEEVFISDAPAKIYKGAMFLFLNSAFVLIPAWFSASQWGNTYPTDPAAIKPYGYIQAFAVWNQYKGYNDAIKNRGIGVNIFSGSILGLTNDWPDLINRYVLTDSSNQTMDRFFMLISVNQDWKSCISNVVLIEVFNSLIGKTYSDNWVFKYISQ